MSGSTGTLKSPRNRNSLALRVILLALFALTQADAAFNAPYPFGQGPSPTTSYVDTDDNNCANGTANLGGVVTNGGLGLSLTGAASLNNSNGLGGYSCILNFVWQGTASGTVGSTATISSNFNFTLTNVISFACTLTVFANGNQVAQFNCVPPSGSSFIQTTQNFTVPANWTSYMVVLATSAQLTQGALSTFGVTVPSNTSIDIGTVSGSPAPTPTGVPALSPAALGITGMLLLLVGYATLRRAKAGAGSPGNCG
jgi:hypothetical protein